MYIYHYTHMNHELNLKIFLFRKTKSHTRATFTETFEISISRVESTEE